MFGCQLEKDHSNILEKGKTTFAIKNVFWSTKDCLKTATQGPAGKSVKKRWRNKLASNSIIIAIIIVRELIRRI